MPITCLALGRGVLGLGGEEVASLFVWARGFFRELLFELQIADTFVLEACHHRTTLGYGIFQCAKMAQSQSLAICSH